MKDVGHFFRTQYYKSTAVDDAGEFIFNACTLSFSLPILKNDPFWKLQFFNSLIMFMKICHRQNPTKREFGKKNIQNQKFFSAKSYKNFVCYIDAILILGEIS